MNAADTAGDPLEPPHRLCWAHFPWLPGTLVYMGLYLATFLCRTALGLLGGPGSQSLMLTSPRGHSHPPLLSLGEIFVSECWCQECLNPDLLPQVTANSDPLATPSWFIEQECCHAIFMDRAQQTSRAFVSLSLGSIAPGEASCHVMRTLEQLLREAHLVWG